MGWITRVDTRVRRRDGGIEMEDYRWDISCEEMYWDDTQEVLDEYNKMWNDNKEEM